MNSLGAKLIPPAAAIMIYAPTLAQACAVCFDSEDDNRQAFIDTTIFLTVLPLGLFAFGIGLLVYRIRKAERTEAERHQAFLAATELLKKKDA
jgi:hypothetical protein